MPTDKYLQNIQVMVLACYTVLLNGTAIHWQLSLYLNDMFIYIQVNIHICSRHGSHTFFITQGVIIRPYIHYPLHTTDLMRIHLNSKWQNSMWQADYTFVLIHAVTMFTPFYELLPYHVHQGICDHFTSF